jgi:hypothetical protein
MSRQVEPTRTVVVGAGVGGCRSDPARHARHLSALHETPVGLGRWFPADKPLPRLGAQTGTRSVADR